MRKKSGRYLPCDSCKVPVYLYKCKEERKHHFCSLRCRYKGQLTYTKQAHAHRLTKVKKICLTCKKDFEVHNYREKTANFCSVSCASKNRSNEKNSRWKGDDVGYGALHTWVMRKKGRATKHPCLFCKKEADQWANIDRKYRRDLNDFVPLCFSCHTKYDKKSNEVRFFQAHLQAEAKKR